MDSSNKTTHCSKCGFISGGYTCSHLMEKAVFTQNLLGSQKSSWPSSWGSNGISSWGSGASGSSSSGWSSDKSNFEEKRANLNNLVGSLYKKK